MDIDEGNEEKVRLLLSASKDGSIMLWKVNEIFSATPSSALIQKWDISEHCGGSGITSSSSFCIAIAFSPSGNSFLIGCPNGTILHYRASASKSGYDTLGPIKLDGKKHSQPVGI